MSCGDEQRLQLRAQVEELLAERRCVMLADDLECLDVETQELFIAKLTSVT